MPIVHQAAAVSAKTLVAVEKVRRFMDKASDLVIAFSGGMDSSLLAIMASRFAAEKYRAILVSSEFTPALELSIARSTAQAFALNFHEMDLHILSEPTISKNDKDRCYHCKKAIFKALAAAAADAVLCEGTVTDDNHDYRPGKRALSELGVCSPLLEAGFSKEMVAEALTGFGAKALVRAAQSCLATRFACNTPITLPGLQQVEQGESLLRNFGLSSLRLRHHGELARLEVLPAERYKALAVLDSLAEKLKSLGFKHICLDAEGYKMGSMNRPG